MAKRNDDTEEKSILDYMQVLNRCHSVSEAARQCGISQSALSNALKHLEMQVEERLFDRKAGAMTRAGHIYVESAVKIQQVLQECRTAMEKMKTGSISFGIDSSLGNTPALQISHIMYERYPELRLFVICEDASVLQEKLKDGSLDLYCALDSNAPGQNEWHRAAPPLSVYLAATRAVAGETTDTPSLLKRCPLVLLRHSQVTRAVDLWMNRNGLVPAARNITNSYDMAHLLAEQTGAVFPIPASMRSELPDLITLPIPGIQVTPRFYCTSRGTANQMQEETVLAMAEILSS